jgi:hypothetical protein
MADARVAVETQGRGRAWWLGQIIGGIIGGVIVLFLIEFDVTLPSPSIGFLARAAMAFVLSVAAHEAGHLTGGALAGFKPLIIAVWPIKLQWEASSWRVRWFHGSKLAGFVSMDPRGASDLRKRMFFMVAAGPLGSGLTGMVAAGLAVLIQPVWSAWIIQELNLVAFWSFLTAVIGFLPIPNRYSVNDGMRLLKLLRGGVEADRYFTLVVLSTSLLSASRPREWRRDLVDRLPGPLDGSPDAILAQAIRYNFLLDSGDLEEAGQALEWLAGQRLTGEARAIWLLEAPWFQAKFRGDLPAARQWMEIAPTVVKSHDGRCALWKARAAIAFLEQRWTDAQMSAEQALEACDQMTDTGITRIIREELKELVQEIYSAKQH